MNRILSLALGALLVVPAAWSAVELNEDIVLVADLDACCAGYAEARDAGHAALNEARYGEAAKAYLKAADLTPYRIVRARHTANAALAYLYEAEVQLGEMGGEIDSGAAKALLQKAKDTLLEARGLADGYEGADHRVNVSGLKKNLKEIEGAIGIRLDRFASKDGGK